MYYLDRFEEGFAVIECNDNGEASLFKVDRALISPEVKEGEALIFRNGIYFTDSEKTEKRRKKILEILRRKTKNE